MPTPQKEARVAELRETLETSPAFYLSDFSGIDAGRLTRLRTAVHEAGGRIEVVKNRLFKLAVTGTLAEPVTPFLTGPTVVTFCREDPVAAGKVLREFAKSLTTDQEHWTIKAAFVAGRVFEGARAEALADLPPTEQIQAAAVGAIAGPLNGLVQTLNGALAGLVYTLQAVADKRQEQAA